MFSFNACADDDTMKNFCRSYGLQTMEGGLYVDRHGWPTKKILGFRWSKKAKIK